MATTDNPSTPDPEDDRIADDIERLTGLMENDRLRFEFELADMDLDELLNHLTVCAMTVGALLEQGTNQPAVDTLRDLARSVRSSVKALYETVADTAGNGF